MLENTLKLNHYSLPYLLEKQLITGSSFKPRFLIDQQWTSSKDKPLHC